MSRLKDTDDFGARMKAYEAIETARKLDPLLPVYARIDGRAFSTFTRGMEQPFDRRLTTAMVETTKHLVHETHARIGYTQSDEINLVWFAEDEKSDIFFSGKVQKMVSVLASMAAAKFATAISLTWQERLPHFDARVFQLPNKIEAANIFLWRAMDARKNAISMSAQAAFSHKQLHGKHGGEMLIMLRERGIEFDDYPEFFKNGTFVRRRTVMRDLTVEEMARIPEQHRPTGPIQRSETVPVPCPDFLACTNREAFVFDGADAECAARKTV